MTGSKPIIFRLLVISTLVIFVTGCQLLPAQESLPPAVTKEELHTSSQALQSNFQQELLALEQRQLSHQQQQVQEVRRIKALLKKYQQENLLLQRQHTFQIEQLGNLLEPGFNNSAAQGFVINSPITEVVQSDGKMLLGEYEWVLLPTQQMVLPARIDSGANTSSLHAINLQQFERDGKTWVRFETRYQPENNQPEFTATIEAPLVRKVNVIQAAGSENRPVITLPIQLGALTQQVEFTLTDRGNLTFPVLLGRRFFMDIAVIDVSKTYVQGKPEVVVAIPAAIPEAIPAETE